MNVTDKDRERAAALLWDARHSGGGVKLGAIAKALAEERERARAPFLALADDLESGFYGYEHTEREIAALIRETAEETTE